MVLSATPHSIANMKRGAFTRALGISFKMKSISIKKINCKTFMKVFGVPFKNFFEADLTLLHLLQSLCSSTWLYGFLILGSHMCFKMI